MSLREEYKNQYRWRSWESVYDLLPDMEGQTILDLGCAVGDQAANFVRRGAKVIGVDLNEELLQEARSEVTENARFIKSNFRTPLSLEKSVDGIWCSFAVAYVPDLTPVLGLWKKYLKKGGWIALTEIDNFFDHEPLSERAESMLEAYARKVYRKVWYDFYMGRKLGNYLQKSGFTIKNTITLEDREFSFNGPASEEVIKAWRKRLDRLKLLQDLCGRDYEDVRNDFLSCLQHDKHRSHCKVICCVGTC